jgi:hypothetical protein
VANLTGWEFKVFFLNSILNCTSVTEGSFLKNIGNTFKVVDIINGFNSTHGRILAACALLGTDVSANGNGDLATITFQAIAQGDTILHLQDVKLSDEKSPPQPIPSIAVDGTVHIGIPPEQVLDVYTQRGGSGANTSSDAFAPGETIFFNASLKYQGAPIPGVIVQFLTYDPHGTPSAGTAVTGADGIASFNATLSSNPLLGSYSTVASANTHGNDYNDTVTYRVGWIVCLQNVIVGNYSGTPLTSFDRGTRVYVNVTFENISFNSKTVFLWVHAWDNNAGDVVREWMLFNVPSGKTTVLLGFRIPQWSARGDGQLYVGAYNNPYWTGGSAYCPGMYSSLTITGS